VSFVSHYSVLYGGMSSILGRNVISCSRHYQLPVNYLLSEQFNVTIVDKICTSRTLSESYSQSMSVLKFIMLNYGIISILGIHFDRTDVNFYFFYFLFFIVLCVRSDDDDNNNKNNKS